MKGLSFSVIGSVVVLIFNVVLFTPVLPSFTPDFSIDLKDGAATSNYKYDLLPSHGSRLRRQVLLSNQDLGSPVPVVPDQDKNILNKLGLPTGTKKPTALEPKPSSVQPQESTSLNGLSQGLPTTQQTSAQLDSSNNNNGVTSNSNKSEEEGSQPFPDDGLLFVGNSTYPHLPINNTYYRPQQQNVTLKKIGKYRYYSVHYDSDGVNKYWVDMKTHDKAKMHDMLSNSHRRAATVKPNFPIIFYGHNVTNITVATGGFIYLGEQVHAWLAATQYVAPLMANFDSSTSLNATLNYVSEDDYFTVEWNQVKLQDSPGVGPFTFQTTLFKNGTIVFVYKTIPIPINAINDTNHPVKVGLSDAYIKDKNMLFVRQKTIYEYDRVDLKNHPNVTITNGTAIIFTKLPTCTELLTCEECTSADISFECAWCPATNKCSNGTDRYYQEWTQKSCDKPKGNFTESLQCSTSKKDAQTYNSAFDQGHDDELDHFHGSDEALADSSVKKIKAPEAEGMSASGVIGVMFLMMLVFGAVGWLAYAYFFPHSPSGQMLIRYRPSTWAFRRGEARYTAASIHM